MTPEQERDLLLWQDEADRTVDPRGVKAGSD